MTDFSCLIFGFLLFALAFASETSQAAAVSNAAYSTQALQINGKGSLKPEQCKGKCSYRCSATSHKKPCNLYCNYCCDRCLCVPPGTSGNKVECSCYNNMKTKDGKSKCP